MLACLRAYARYGYPETTSLHHKCLYVSALQQFGVKSKPSSIYIFILFIHTAQRIGSLTVTVLYMNLK